MITYQDFLDIYIMIICININSQFTKNRFCCTFAILFYRSINPFPPASHIEWQYMIIFGPEFPFGF